MQIFKIALMALTASGAIAAPLQGSEAALEQRGVDVKPATTELNARDIHDENGLLTRRGGGFPRRPKPPSYPSHPPSSSSSSSSRTPSHHSQQLEEMQKGLYSIQEGHNEGYDSQGSGRKSGKPPRYAGSPAKYGTKNEPSAYEKYQASRKKQ